MLDLLASGRLTVSDLVTHTFGIGDAAAAYELIDKRTDPYVAIQLTYQAKPTADAPVVTRPRPGADQPAGIGWVGAGSFSTGTLLPSFRRAGFKQMGQELEGLWAITHGVKPA